MLKTWTDFEVAKLLSDSLCYVKAYRGQTVVVKYGGNAMTDATLSRSVLRDIVLLNMIGVRVVLVHGGGPGINQTLKALNIESKFVKGLRVTDEDTMRVVRMVLAGDINKTLVSTLNDEGGRAVGLSGVDAQTIEAEAYDQALGLVGEVKAVNVDLINSLLDKGYIPVVASVASGPNGTSLNVNADTAAAALAGALNAKRLILMTNIDGLLRDPAVPQSLISTLSLDEIPPLIEEGVISGGMIPKVECAQRALDEGVQRVVIMNGTLPHSLLVEMLTKGGIGTMIMRARASTTP